MLLNGVSVILTVYFFVSSLYRYVSSRSFLSSYNNRLVVSENPGISDLSCGRISAVRYEHHIESLPPRVLKCAIYKLHLHIVVSVNIVLNLWVINLNLSVYIGQLEDQYHQNMINLSRNVTKRD